MRGKAVTVLVTLILVLSAPVALAATGGHGQSTDARDGTHRSIVQQNSTNNSSVTVGVGQQLSTVVVEADSDVRTDVEETTTDAVFQDSNASARAEYLSQRSDALAERAESLQDAYEEVTQAYVDGELSRDAYAQRLASLNARAENVQRSIIRTRTLASEVSVLELRTAGYSQTELQQAMHSLDVLTGAGISELRQRFTGQDEGAIELDNDDDGLSVSVSSAAGDRIREIDRASDDSASFTVGQSTALQTARSALHQPTTGSWTLHASGIDRATGAYEFTFTLTGTDATGSATVAVDGSSGKVFSLTSMIDVPDGSAGTSDGDDSEADGGDAGDGEVGDSDDGDDDDDDDSEGSESGDGDAHDGDAADGDSEASTRGLTVLVTNGSLDDGGQITIRALDGSSPVAGASVSIDGQQVGTTNADGTFQLGVPDEDTTIRVATQTASGSLEIDVAEDEDAEFASNLDASATASNGQVTVWVTYEGSGVGGASVLVDGQHVGTTDASGSLTFDANTASTLDITVVKGEFEATFTFTQQNGDYAHTSTTVGDADEDDGDADESEDGSDTDSGDGDATDGESTDGDTSDGDSTDGDSTDGDNTDGDSSDGDSSDGDTSDSDSSDGDNTDGDSSDGDSTDSDSTDGDSTDSDIETNDSDSTDGDSSDGDSTDGD